MPEEPALNVFGLRCLYNFVHKCWEAWRFINEHVDMKMFFKRIKFGPLNGDEDNPRIEEVRVSIRNRWMARRSGRETAC